MLVTLLPPFTSTTGVLFSQYTLGMHYIYRECYNIYLVFNVSYTFMAMKYIDKIIRHISISNFQFNTHSNVQYTSLTYISSMFSLIHIQEAPKMSYNSITITDSSN